MHLPVYGTRGGTLSVILSGPAPSSPPNPTNSCAPIHNRMPVILPKELESFWLDDEVQDPFALGRYFESLSCRSDAGLRSFFSLVNRPSNEGPEVAIPVGQESPLSGAHQAQLVMFQHGGEETIA